MSTALSFTDSAAPVDWAAPSPKVTANSSPDAAREIDELLRLVRRDTLTLLYGVSGSWQDFAPSSWALPSLTGGRLPSGPDPAGLRWTARLRSPGKCSPPSPKPPMRPASKLQRRFPAKRFGSTSIGKAIISGVLATTSSRRFLRLRSIRGVLPLSAARPPRERRAQPSSREFADLVENRPPAALRDDPQRAREFSFKPRPLKVLLAMREDYLAELDRIRSQFRARTEPASPSPDGCMPQARASHRPWRAANGAGVEDRIIEVCRRSAAADADDG